MINIIEFIFKLFSEGYIYIAVVVGFVTLVFAKITSIVNEIQFIPHLNTFIVLFGSILVLKLILRGGK